MATYNGLLLAAPPAASFGGKSAPPRAGLLLGPSAVVTTYDYFTQDGVYGTTADPLAVPPTAGIVRIETSNA